MIAQTSPSRDFFVAGGTLRYDAPSYVVRPADEDLHHLVQSGTLCYVLTTRQMGKSSLMNRLGKRLQAEGIATALIDLTTIGTASLEEWYLSLLDDLQIQLDLSTDAEAWWGTQAGLSPVKRFTKFFRDVVLVEAAGQVAIFIDEVDSALNLDFSDDFFAAIRAIYNQTLTATEAGRLSFVLLGVATPNELIKSQHRTPFNVGERLDLEELELTEAQAVFSQALPVQDPPVIDQVYNWTGGHPYLTQRVCQAVARDNQTHWTPEEIDGVVARLFFSGRSLVEESNLQFVNGRLLASSQKEQLLRLYQKVYEKKHPVLNDERNLAQTELKLYGLVKTNPEGHLVVRNAIYHHVFNLAWIKQHRETSRKRLAWLALILITIISVGFSLYLWQQAQRSQDLLAETYIANFNATENPTLRLDNLAQLLSLGNYDEEAESLFTTLPAAEQIALFTNPTGDLQPQLERVVEAMASTQGTDTITADSESTLVLAAMLTALKPFDRLENPVLMPEIENWLAGRTAVGQGNLSAAQLAYSVAISLNETNPATRYERALVALALPDNDAALADLAVLLAYGSVWQTHVEKTIANHPQLYAFIAAEDGRFTELAAFLPSPTTTTTLSSPTAPSPTAAATDTKMPEPTATLETAVFINTPLSIPHTNPSGRIVYTCFIEAVDQICSIDADGANRTQLTATDTTDWTASFTPEQQSILFSSSRSGTFGLYETDSSGENTKLLLAPVQGDYAPSVSPDGKKVAFTRAEDGNQNIWVTARDGSDAQPLTALTGDALSPSWSPDSQQIAFAQKLLGETGHTLIITNADGTNPYTLPLPLSDIHGHTDWSPDGNWLAFYAGATNRRDIYLVAVDGSAYYRITDSGDNLGPSFSADSSWLVFTSSRDGDNDLYLIRLDGTELTPLTENDFSDWQPSWGKY